MAMAYKSCSKEGKLGGQTPCNVKQETANLQFLWGSACTYMTAFFLIGRWCTCKVILLIKEYFWRGDIKIILFQKTELSQYFKKKCPNRVLHRSTQNHLIVVCDIIEISIVRWNILVAMATKLHQSGGQETISRCNFTSNDIFSKASNRNRVKWKDFTLTIYRKVY